MKKIALATAIAFFASIIAAAAMPGNPIATGTTDTGLIQVKAKKAVKGVHHMGKDMKGGKEMKGMEGMKGKDMKDMKGMKGM